MAWMIPPAIVATLRNPAPTAADFVPTRFIPADSKAWLAIMWTVKPGVFRVVSRSTIRLGLAVRHWPGPGILLGLESKNRSADHLVADEDALKRCSYDRVPLHCHRD